MINVNNKIKKEKGFTLLELLVTIFIIAIGLIGAYIIAQYPLSQISVSMNRLKAAYLAQEGIEIVRNIRDTNWIEKEDWTRGLTQAINCRKEEGEEKRYCEADYDDISLEDFNQENDSPRLLKILNSGFYGYSESSGTETKFTRKINIKNPSGEDYLKVEVVVDWSEKGKDYSFDLQENLYNYWGD